MKIVQGDEVAWKRGLQHCGGTFYYRHLLEGTPGTTGNFHLRLVLPDFAGLSLQPVHVRAAE